MDRRSHYLLSYVTGYLIGSIIGLKYLQISVKMEALKGITLPPGFGFHPTDVELVFYYLKRKNMGLKADLDVIPELEIYKFEPWDLPACCHIPTQDSKWHFFTSRDRKYPNGLRSNRATAAGYWKSTGKDRNIRSQNQVIGTKKTLVFHEGRPPYGKRTDWIMHEYDAVEKENTAHGMKGTYVLCRVTKEMVFPSREMLRLHRLKVLRVYNKL
ncbi:hypothetical protein HPP92_004541 [Vanilla planifolia]|uniref:NAC domain-containing protein n=1 Tax=Vanilla planifolia TaxID=51239 RepID=A0A835RXM3_VANPL|nr:hypothetical protein HPP92_004541 [Vanilla planifolia]